MKAFFMKSIKWHIIVWFSILNFIAMVLYAAITYNISSNTLTTEISTYSSKIVDEARNSLDLYFTQIESLLQITASNSTLITAMKNHKYLEYGEKLYYDRLIGDFLQDTLKINQKIKDIIIIDNEGYFYDSTGRGIKPGYNFFEQKWFPNISGGDFKSNYIGLHPQDYYLYTSDTDEDVISAVIPVADYMDPKRDFYAVVMFNLKVENILEVNKEITLEKSGFFLLVDNNNRMVYRPQNYKGSEKDLKLLMNKLKHDSGSFVSEYNRQEMMIVYKTSKATKWKFIALIPREEVLNHFKNIKKSAYIFTIICILLVIGISVFISAKITKPISRLIDRMGRIEQGNFDVKLYDDSTEEIEKLSCRMDIMIERINSLNKDIYHYQIINREAVIKALQTQINPHFLYNTLQGIKSMAVCGKNTEISRMVTLLGNMLRYSVYNSKELVPIAEELKHVREYLEIQSFRYPGQFEYEIECNPCLENFRTLKLILQPIVENSIQHGIVDKNNGLIRIQIKKHASGIEFTVFDNGKRINTEEIEKIKQYINDRERMDESHSIGLKNVHERVRLRFGIPYGIELSAIENEGTYVRILIPEVSEGEKMDASVDC